DVVTDPEAVAGLGRKLEGLQQCSGDSLAVAPRHAHNASRPLRLRGETNMNRRWIVVLCLCLDVSAADVGAQSASEASSGAPARGAMAPSRPGGYLGRDGIPDHRLFMPPPPADDGPLGIADVAVFRATRSLEGSPRWELATRDAEAG